uniref:Uncharacterized protein n=1 Tax=Rhizophora mucronata TaxID=61149 RepID=A0A2P2LEB2_RHIMU
MNLKPSDFARQSFPGVQSSKLSNEGSFRRKKDVSHCYVLKMTLSLLWVRSCLR